MYLRSFDCKWVLVTFRLDDPARFAGILCTSGWRKKPYSNLCGISILKSHSVIAIYLSHTENEIEKPDETAKCYALLFMEILILVLLSIFLKETLTQPMIW